MVELEVGFKLNYDQKYYVKILQKHHAVDRKNAETHDIYWTNKKLDGMSENEMKKACVRLRMTRSFSGKDVKWVKKFKNLFGVRDKWNLGFQNYKIFDEFHNNNFNISEKELNQYITDMENKGFKKIIDTYKTDYQYAIGNMKSRIQLQNIKDIGLILYYDNPDIYDLPLEEQRRKLIDELNSYGFNFKYDELGLDKLRTIYYKKEMYSNNQNG